MLPLDSFFLDRNLHDISFEKYTFSVYQHAYIIPGLILRNGPANVVVPSCVKHWQKNPASLDHWVILGKALKKHGFLCDSPVHYFEGFNLDTHTLLSQKEKWRLEWTWTNKTMLNHHLLMIQELSHANHVPRVETSLLLEQSYDLTWWFVETTNHFQSLWSHLTMDIYHRPYS